MLERDGMTPDASIAIQKLLAKGRIDTIVLYLVVAVMVVKPTGDDVGLLAAMAAIVVLGLMWTVTRVRALDGVSPRGPAAAPGA